MEQKACSKCGESFPLSNYRFDNIAKGRRKPACRECENKRMREDRAKHRDKRRAYDRRRYRGNPVSRYVSKGIKVYGLTKEQAQAAALVTECDLCGRDNGSRRMNIDHCHATGRVRGLLCQNCNLGLGHLNDPEILPRAAEYLLKGGSGRF